MGKNLEEWANKIIDTDLLILGGGLAGSMAAIMAEKKGIDVVIIEKAGIRRSGQGGRGFDHYASIAHPAVNGLDAEEYGRKRANDLAGMASEKLSIITAKDALRPIPILEEIGVKIREEDGTFRMISHRLGGGVAGDCILYRGGDLKLRLADKIQKCRIKIFERTMFTSLITKDNSVIGATTLNVRTGKFMVFRARVVLMATGGAYSRMYNNPFSLFPNNLFTGCGNPANAGAGHMAAYRAGAKLTNLEFTFVSIQTLFGCPSPQGAVFSGKMKNSLGELLFDKYPEVREKEKGGGFYPWGRYPFMPTMEDPEIEKDVISYYWDNVPIEADWFGSFMAASETPNMLKMIKGRGGLRKAPFELYPWLQGIIRGFGGIIRDENGESSVKDLFIAGDVGGGMPGFGSTGAFVWGYRIAEYLACILPDMKKKDFDREQINQVKSEKSRIMAPLKYKEGMRPLELEDLTRKIMTYHVGIKKIAPRLKRALELMEILKRDFVPKLSADSPHEQMRAIEVMDIIDICELHAHTALLRTETRMPPYHYRMDYPKHDDENWKANIIIKQKNGELIHNVKTLD